MKSKWFLIGSIMQIILAVLAIGAYILLVIDGENMAKWTITLIFGVLLIIDGIIGVMIYKRK